MGHRIVLLVFGMNLDPIMLPIRRKLICTPDDIIYEYILRSLFPQGESFQRQGRSSCMVRREELFTLEELKRADGKLKSNMAPGIGGMPNEILAEVSSVYPEILLEAFNSCLQDVHCGRHPCSGGHRH